MFLPKRKPKDYDCGLNLDLMIEALPRIQDEQKRVEYAKRIVGLIKQSHISWVDENGCSEEAWTHFYRLAEYDPRDYGIQNPYEVDGVDDAL
ncbi:DUF4290 domain-containing protein [Natronogracilivirga saccharolytica]|uniref:DUF4290 domain-containing protein n=1 Tax=Natronogracilivirga saccharolytica TaxID=2812953 RepID=A0A8J7RNQ6_9BACT|nr:DUF4290 domain-containing protein [Natronogracilivirga saccharolytica]MBP3193114.1 DUF4290 domain-containing protein [Natronogracilivirga saccharolytica]